MNKAIAVKKKKMKMKEKRPGWQKALKKS